MQHLCSLRLFQVILEEKEENALYWVFFLFIVYCNFFIAYSTVRCILFHGTHFKMKMFSLTALLRNVLLHFIVSNSLTSLVDYTCEPTVH